MPGFIEIAVVSVITLAALTYLVRKLVLRFRPGAKACGRCGCGCETSKSATGDATSSAGEVRPVSLTMRGLDRTP